MSKQKYPSNDIELLEASEIEYPKEYKTASICSDKVINAIEAYATALSKQSDLTYVLYWLQITTYANTIMDGLTEQIRRKK